MNNVVSIEQARQARDMSMEAILKDLVIAKAQHDCDLFRSAGMSTIVNKYTEDIPERQWYADEVKRQGMDIV